MNLVAYIFAMILTQPKPIENFYIIPAPVIIQKTVELPQPTVVPATPIEPQGEKIQPTGCYWGDSIPIEACDKNVK